MESSLRGGGLTGQDGREMSDQYVHELLKDAEQRLGSASKGSCGTATARQQSSTGSPRNCLSSRLSDTLTSSYIGITNQGAQVDRVVVMAKERNTPNSSRMMTDPAQLKPASQKAKMATAGADWYDLYRTILTPELKRDMQLLQLRSVLDPKQHFKKETGRPLVPEFSQVGTIVEGATEFFSARLTKKERKQTLIEDVLARESTTQRFWLKYNQIQSAKLSGKRAHYKKRKAKIK